MYVILFLFSRTSIGIRRRFLMSRRILVLSLLLALSSVAVGCYPGYDLVQRPPDVWRGTRTVMLEPLAFTQGVLTVVSAGLARRGVDSTPRGVDTWLSDCKTNVRGACSGFLQASGFQVIPNTAMPAQGTFFVRARIEIIEMHFGSTAGRVLGALFRKRRHTRGANAWMRARILLFAPGQTIHQGEATVRWESNSAAFQQVYQPLGRRCAYFVRDSLAVR
jgi:hypothetical protein